MSNWKEISKKDIDIDNGELEIFLGEDEHGNNYAVIKMKDILELMKKTFSEK